MLTCIVVLISEKCPFIFVVTLYGMSGLLDDDNDETDDDKQIFINDKLIVNMVLKYWRQNRIAQPKKNRRQMISQPVY